MKNLQMPSLHKKQLEFFEATTRYVCFGGARGGGKTFSIIWKSILLAAKYPGIVILVVRQTFPELTENFTIPMKSILNNTGVASYKEYDKSFYFTNGSRIKLGYCAGDNDLDQYQGPQFDVIFIDEATQFTEYQFLIINAACRGINPDFPRRTYLTCNPGGVGHDWVKRLFIDRDYRGKENPEDYTFIQAKVTDNPTLLKNNPEYIATLEALPDGKRQAWLDGDWNVFAGQYFTEFDANIHVIEPFPIPERWNRYFTLDYGLDMCAGLWLAQDENGNSFLYRELYKPDLIISEAAKRILDIEGNDRIRERLAPPDLWNRQRDTGKSIIGQFNEYGLYFTKSSNERIAGWLAVKEMLKIYNTPDGGKTSRLKIFNTCPNIIRCMPRLRYDDNQSGDVAKEPHELTHAPDALRGYCVSFTSATKPLPEPATRFSFSLPSPPPSPVGFGEKIRVV